MNPEIYSYLVPKLFAKGALDVYLTNIIMKKNRPGVMINVLCREDEANIYEGILFEETTTLGIRKYRVDREALEREFAAVDTRFGAVTVKMAKRRGKVIKWAPEYEECKAIAERFDTPLKDVYEAVLTAINKKS